MTPDPAEATDVLRLDEVLDLRAARPLLEALRARRGQDLALDASAVRRLGGLCLQALLAAIDAWAADGRRLAFLNPSPGFIDGLERLGVSRALAAPDLLPET